jgi:hypothetical protein
MNIMDKLVCASFTTHNAWESNRFVHTIAGKPAIGKSFVKHHSNTLPPFLWNGFQDAADATNVLVDIALRYIVTQISESPNQQRAPVIVGGQSRFADEIIVFTLQPGERSVPKTRTHEPGLSPETNRAVRQPSTFKGLRRRLQYIYICIYFIYIYWISWSYLQGAGHSNFLYSLARSAALPGVDVVWEQHLSTSSSSQSPVHMVLAAPGRRLVPVGHVIHMATSILMWPPASAHSFNPPFTTPPPY